MRWFRLFIACSFFFASAHVLVEHGPSWNSHCSDHHETSAEEAGGIDPTDDSDHDLDHQHIASFVRPNPPTGIHGPAVVATLPSFGSIDVAAFATLFIGEQPPRPPGVRPHLLSGVLLI
ncbi:hypothetical protein HS125_11510 [bacterium]|nr:hypothetical protein [bacterium]